MTHLFNNLILYIFISNCLIKSSIYAELPPFGILFRWRVKTKSDHKTFRVLLVFHSIFLLEGRVGVFCLDQPVAQISHRSVSHFENFSISARNKHKPRLRLRKRNMWEGFVIILMSAYLHQDQ